MEGRYGHRDLIDLERDMEAYAKAKRDDEEDFGIVPPNDPETPLG
jgi:hypothetical protein